MSATPYGVALMHPSETYAFPPMHDKEKKGMNFFYTWGQSRVPPYFRKWGCISFSKI